MRFKKWFLPSVLAAAVLAVAVVPALAECAMGKDGKTCPMMGNGMGQMARGMSGRSGMHSGHHRLSGCPILGKFNMKAYWLMRHKDELGLTADQVAKIKSLQLDMAKNMIRGQAEMKIGMMEMENQLSQETLNVEAIESMIDSGMAGMATGAKASVKAYAELKSLLTEEQKAKAKEIWVAAEKAEHASHHA